MIEALRRRYELVSRRYKDVTGEDPEPPPTDMQKLADLIRHLVDVVNQRVAARAGPPVTIRLRQAELTGGPARCYVEALDAEGKVARYGIVEVPAGSGSIEDLETAAIGAARALWGLQP